MNRSFRWVAPLLITGLVGPVQAHAGENAGGTVRLSWDAAGRTSTLSVPDAAVFPLFLHIDGATDIREVALHLKWVPYDSTGQCYSVVPASADANCGWTVDGPGGVFEGDSTYTWSILFPLGSTDRNCVVYWVSMATCDSAPPAKFYVADARVKDSSGAVDTLQNIGDTKLLGGPVADSLPGQQQFATDQSSPAGLSLIALPNPTAAGVVLQFRLPGPVPHSLGIYDIAGRLLRRAATTPSMSGAGSFNWDLTASDGRRVGAGLYFARLVTAAGTRVVPLTVLR